MKKSVCNKKTFNSKADAIKALHAIKNKNNEKHRECRAYECEICKGKWHLTSTPLIKEKLEQTVRNLVHKEAWLKLLES